MGCILSKESAMGIDFYYTHGSAPCRSVLLTAKALGIKLNLKPLNLGAGEHLSPEFVKLNPQHTVPTLNDNGFVLWESRAICTYLINKYGKDDSIYPKDPKSRAVVDQRLYFDIGTLYQRFAEYYYPHIFAGVPYDPEKKSKIDDAMKFLETFLDGQTWAAGSSMTVADLCLVASISTFEVMEYDFSPYPNIQKWYAKVKSSAPGYEEANGDGCKAFKGLVDHMTKK